MCLLFFNYAMFNIKILRCLKYAIMLETYNVSFAVLCRNVKSNFFLCHRCLTRSGGKMCGRTACTLAPDEVSRACLYTNRAGRRRQPRWRDGDADQYKPSYNKSPQSQSPVLLSQRHFDKASKDVHRVWGQHEKSHLEHFKCFNVSL